MLKGWADLNMANPSWCFEVMMIHFIPASLASCAIPRALNSVGLNSFCTFRRTDLC